MKTITLTTNDNPYNPITDFDEWFAFDTQKGYNTCSLLARTIEQTSPSLVEESNIELAIDEIVKENGTLYIKLVTDDAFST